MRTTPFLAPFLIALGIAALWPSAANAQRYAPHPATGPVHVVDVHPSPHVASGGHSHFDLAVERVRSATHAVERLEAQARGFFAMEALNDLGRARGDLSQAQFVLRTHGSVHEFDRAMDAAERRIHGAERELRRAEGELRRHAREVARAVAELDRLPVRHLDAWTLGQVDLANRHLADAERHLRREEYHVAAMRFEDARRAADSARSGTHRLERDDRRRSGRSFRARGEGRR